MVCDTVSSLSTRSEASDDDIAAAPLRLPPVSSAVEAAGAVGLFRWRSRFLVCDAVSSLSTRSEASDDDTLSALCSPPPLAPAVEADGTAVEPFRRRSRFLVCESASSLSTRSDASDDDILPALSLLLPGKHAHRASLVGGRCRGIGIGGHTYIHRPVSCFVFVPFGASFADPAVPSAPSNPWENRDVTREYALDTPVRTKI